MFMDLPVGIPMFKHWQSVRKHLRVLMVYRSRYCKMNQLLTKKRFQSITIALSQRLKIVRRVNKGVNLNPIQVDEQLHNKYDKKSNSEFKKLHFYPISENRESVGVSFDPMIKLSGLDNKVSENGHVICHALKVSGPYTTFGPIQFHSFGPR
ncbi:hypothetical protein K435DRAFT_809832 [Dendrothele bispora CBS 962.96]|uniref:Uncharacterized protein n=1 Tax=Dendrothele bispora (strain CBS 962.96) TaxID=1314807 RepID=A0A4S8KXE2_DENBC|nr:hypothetical protein K435DRAFT_809832 [Dendrothele bispora CBS 962.96]